VKRNLNYAYKHNYNLENRGLKYVNMKLGHTKCPTLSCLASHKWDGRSNGNKLCKTTV